MSSSSSSESRYRPTPSATTATTENTTATVLIKLFSSTPKTAASLLTDIRPLFRFNDNINNFLEWKDPPSSALLLISFIAAVSFLNPNTIFTIHSAVLAILAIFTWGWFTAKRQQAVKDIMLLTPHSDRLPIPSLSPNTPSLTEPFTFPTSADVASLTTNMEQLAALLRRFHTITDEIRDLIMWKRSSTTLRVIKILLFLVYPSVFLLFRLFSTRLIILFVGSLFLIWYSPWFTLIRQLVCESNAVRRVKLFAETATEKAARVFTRGRNRLTNAFTARKSVKRTGQRKRKSFDKEAIVRSLLKINRDAVNANGEREGKNDEERVYGREGEIEGKGKRKEGEEEIEQERESKRKTETEDEDDDEKDEEEEPVPCSCDCHCQWPRGTPQDNQKRGNNTPILLTPNEFKVFENQRWWVGLEWAPMMLPAERPCWSDENGDPSFNPTEFKFPPIPTYITSSIESTCTTPTSSTSSPTSTPTSYCLTERNTKDENKYYWKWIDPTWRITAPPSSSVFSSKSTFTDTHHTTSDIVSQLPHTPSPSLDEDPEGWEYTDSLWLFPTPTLTEKSRFGFGKSLRSKLKITRRRRWARVAGVYTNCECKCK